MANKKAISGIISFKIFSYRFRFATSLIPADFAVNRGFPDKMAVAP
jgi:hypothetical protein